MTTRELQRHHRPGCARKRVGKRSIGTGDTVSGDVLQGTKPPTLSQSQSPGHQGPHAKRERRSKTCTKCRFGDVALKGRAREEQGQSGEPPKPGPMGPKTRRSQRQSKLEPGRPAKIVWPDAKRQTQQKKTKLRPRQGRSPK